MIVTTSKSSQISLIIVKNYIITILNCLMIKMELIKFKFFSKKWENWIRYSEEYSVIINVNLSKGILYGFCRKGFDYYKINNNSKKLLNVRILKTKEKYYVLSLLHQIKESVIIWLR